MPRSYISPLRFISTLWFCLIFASCSGGSGTGSQSSSGDSFGNGGGISGSGSGGTGTGGSGGSDAPGANPGGGSSQIGSGGPSGSSGGSSGGGGRSSLSINPGSGSGGTSRASISFSGSTSAADGFSIINLLVSNTTSFQIVSEIDGSLLRTFSLVSPNGDTVVDDSNPITTSAVLTDFSVNSLPYPTRGADASITPGTYVQNLVIAASGAVSYSGSVVAKNDPNNSSGTLRVNLFLVGDSAQTGNGRSAVDSAVALWRNIYAQIGVTLSVQIINVRSDTGVIPNPSVGSNFYLQQINDGSTQPDALNVFIGSEISQDSSTTPGNSLSALGIAPSIPGPATATIKSAVAISLLLHAGAGGDFSAANIQTLSETLGHEAGHYLGLFHPVECASAFCSSGSFTGGDPLSDTPTCTNEASCLSNGLANDLMFPVPVLSGGVFVAQNGLTSQQGEVINLQAIVD